MLAVRRILQTKNSSVRKTKQNRLIFSSSCAVCGQKKSTFIKNQEIKNISSYLFKINKIINAFLITGNKFMPEFNFKKPENSAFTKHRKRNQKLRERGNVKHLYRNELDKACFCS